MYITHKLLQINYSNYNHIISTKIKVTKNVLHDLILLKKEGSGFLEISKSLRTKRISLNPCVSPSIILVISSIYTMVYTTKNKSKKNTLIFFNKLTSKGSITTLIINRKKKKKKKSETKIKI